MSFKGRKVTAFIITLIWLSCFVGLIVFFKPNPLWSSFFMLVISCFTLITMAFIGSTVWKDWIKSKHFKAELFDGGGGNET